MAKVAGTYQTYQAVGNREDLANMIYDISPTETPFMSNAARGKCSFTKTEWQTDVLKDATAANIVIEGDVATVDTAVATVRLGNYTQISDKVPMVAGTQDAVDSAGRRNEMSYQIAKRGKELKRDIEKRLSSGSGAAIGTAATGREAAGFGCFCWNNKTEISGATASVASYATGGVPITDVIHSTVLTNATLTEQDLKTTLSNCWDDGGDPNMVLVGSWNKQRISGFSGIATQYRDNPQAGAATIIGAADVYVGDFNTVNIVPSRFTDVKSVYVIDTSTIEVKYLRPIQMEALAKTGDASRKLLLAEYTLCVRSPDANGIILTTTTS